MTHAKSHLFGAMLACLLVLLFSLTAVAQTDQVSVAIQRLHDADPSVSYQAAQALGLIGDVRAVEPLIAVLRGKNFSLKCAAVESLGKLKDPRAFEPLSVLLWKGEGELQTKAQYALTEMGPMVVEPLCRILLEQNNPLRFFVADLLTKIPDVRAIGPLVSVL